MNINQQLEQVIAYANKEAEIASVHHLYYAHLEEIVSRLSAIVKQIHSASAEPVAWMFLRAYGNGLSFVRPDDYEDEDGNPVTPRPLYAAPQVPDGMALVPLTPTRNMIEAGIYAQQPNQPLGGSGNANRLRRRAMRVYGSMLSAAAKEEADEATGDELEQALDDALQVLDLPNGHAGSS